MDYRELHEIAERVRGIPLTLVLGASGARPDPRDRAKWRTERGPVSVSGAKFMNWRHGVGGGGAIDLVLHLRQGGFIDAVRWLSERFPNTTEHSSVGASVRRRLKLPARDARRLADLRRYLYDERRLSISLVEALVATRKIYSDFRGNVVFVLLGEDGRAVGAELRGTTRRAWRGMAPGSSKDKGFFSVCASLSAAAVVLTESAIDAVSCAEIHPDSLCVSTVGARANPRWLPRLLEEGKQVYCGFDSDATGDQLAEAMMALYPAVRRLRPSLKDWNDTLRAAKARS
jgi:hypothetical protein